MFALIDCNNFYVSCERLFNPGLRGRPVVVLSNNDGCFISRSEEAKAIGLGMGEPAFKCRELLQQHRVALYSANFPLYGDLSARVMRTLADFAPDIEIYSIDECFLDLSGFGRFDLDRYARQIRQTVEKHTGIPVSIGIGATKTLAKAASRMAKKNASLGGVSLLRTDAGIRDALSGMAVEHIWGIGRRYGALLHRHRIHTALDFAAAPAPWVRRNLHITGARVQEELNGRSCLPLELVRPPKQSICTSRSFGTPVIAKEELQHAVVHFASKCAFKLRREESRASLVTVFACTSPFAPKEKRYWGTETLSLPAPSNDTLLLLKAATLALERLYRRGYEYKKAGVILSGIGSVSEPQQTTLSLFDTDPLPEKQGRAASLMEALDALNFRYGPGTLRLASDCSSGWKQRQEKLSPAYTTRWSDIIEVKP
ncbi:Y-family DNA polymerase [Chlorobium ferrooxidans]|uniref:DNA-directed DNA polymerase n=1 Tax=Chlorobium ferrooxidans DSM 13031 TaxID=377431 RepID=Q0YT86_9CHLB|nr:Y-family DNA polymerase [Chlorobium ferrooxidans]EAT59381.1 DNA-directed DNA polymerase [Chlorobium ferrooxidans DSM 13031]